jgi:hypothetical protein
LIAGGCACAALAVADIVDVAARIRVLGGVETKHWEVEVVDDDNDEVEALCKPLIPHPLVAAVRSLDDVASVVPPDRRDYILHVHTLFLFLEMFVV